MAKILIVDDDPDITFATELFLKKAQHEVRRRPTVPTA